jgi:hypothetical protein
MLTAKRARQLCDVRDSAVKDVPFKLIMKHQKKLLNSVDGLIRKAIKEGKNKVDVKSAVNKFFDFLQARECAVTLYNVIAYLTDVLRREGFSVVFNEYEYEIVVDWIDCK